MRNALLSLVFVVCACSEPEELHTRVPLERLHAATIAQDWRNSPDWPNLVNYDFVTISTRAQMNGGPVGGTPAAENLIANGVSVLFVIFPVFFWYMGEPLPEGDWDRTVNDLAVQYDAILKREDGSWATTASLAGGYVLDFRNRAFVREYARRVVEVAQIGQGILEHGACASMGWDPELQFLSESDWEEWSSGFQFYFSELRRLRPDWQIVSVCDRWGAWTNEMYDGLFFEHIGSSLNPIGDKVYNELATAGDRNVVALYDAPFPARRRGAAAMAILWDALFMVGREATTTQNVEHFGIRYGDFPDPPTEIAPGVWERVGTHGFVVGNFSSAPYDYSDPIEGRSFTIGAVDGLTVQFRDTSTDAPLTDWVTNEGQ